MRREDANYLDKHFGFLSRWSPISDHDEEMRLICKAQDGDQAAREYVLMCNARFILKVAKEYDFCDIPSYELFNEGMIGADIALTKFDTTKGTKFISYAVWWARQRIRDYTKSNWFDVYVPVYLLEKLRKLRLFLANKDFADIPPIPELCEMFEIPEMAMFILPAIISTPVSLDTEVPTPGSDSNDKAWADVLDLGGYENSLDGISKKSFREFLRGCVRDLGGNHAKILERYFFSEDAVRLQDIADEMALSRQRVHQIKDEALDFLRNDRGLLREMEIVRKAG